VTCLFGPVELNWLIFSRTWVLNGVSATRCGFCCGLGDSKIAIFWLIFDRALGVSLIAGLRFTDAVVLCYAMIKNTWPCFVLQVTSGGVIENILEKRFLNISAISLTLAGKVTNKMST